MEFKIDFGEKSNKTEFDKKKQIKARFDKKKYTKV